MKFIKELIGEMVVGFFPVMVIFCVALGGLVLIYGMFKIYRIILLACGCFGFAVSFMFLTGLLHRKIEAWSNKFCGRNK